MKRLLVLGVLLLSACSLVTPAPGRPRAAPATTPAPPAPTPGAGGLSLAEEIGAVMMVGFQGPLTDAVRQQWRAHQYGGLLIVNLNRNAADAAGMRALITGLRSTMTHPLLVATDQEGGPVCLEIREVPCLAGGPQAGMQSLEAITAQMRTMASALKRLGFDADLAPVADVWDGEHPVMRERSYGRDAGVVAQDVVAAIAGIHGGGLLAAAKHFPGHGAADGDSHQRLPVVGLSLTALREREWLPFRAAAGAGVDFVVLGHLSVPALDAGRPSSLSPLVIAALRQEISFLGVVISDDLEMAALQPNFPPPVAALRFLESGGDMVLVAHNLGVADEVYRAIEDAVRRGEYPRERLDASVRRILPLRAGS